MEYTIAYFDSMKVVVSNNNINSINTDNNYNPNKIISAEMISQNDVDLLLKEQKNINEIDVYNNILQYLVILNKSINNILELNKFIEKFIVSNLKDKRSFDICIERYMHEKTLREIGEKAGVTRERVRQITGKFETKFFLSEIQEFIKRELNIIFNDRFIDVFRLDQIISSDYHFIINLLKLNKSKSIKYISLVDRIYLVNEDLEFDEKKLYKKIDFAINSLEIIGNYEDMITNINSLQDELGSIDSYILEKIFDFYKIRKINNQYIILKNIKKDIERLEIYMKYIYKNGIDFSNEELITKISEDFIFYFGKNTKKNSRNWESIASRIEDNIQINPRTYKHINNLDINLTEVDFVKNRIDYYLNDMDFIFADKLYIDLKNNFCHTTIQSKHEMYSLIKYFFENDFNFATGNSLKFSNKDTLEKSNVDILYDVCNEKNGVITFKEIIEKTKWNKHRIEMAISYSDDIIKFGNEKCVIVDSLFKDNEKELFENKLKLLFKNKFTTSEYILDGLIFSKDFSDFIIRNNITDSNLLSNIIKHLNSNIEGHTVFLYTKDSPIKSLEDLLENEFTEGFTRNDFIDLLKNYKVKDTTINSYLRDLTNVTTINEDSKYFSINKEEYLRIEKFNIDYKYREKIEKYFEEIYQKNKFVIPNKEIQNIKNEIGSTKYGLNQYIISNILMQSGYKKIYRYNESYRNEIIVLVKKDSKYEDLKYLVYDLLNSEYTGELYQRYVYDFLSEKGFYEIETYDFKKLLREDVISEFMDVDIAGRIKLKEVNID